MRLFVIFTNGFRQFEDNFYVRPLHYVDKLSLLSITAIRDGGPQVLSKVSKFWNEQCKESLNKFFKKI